MANPDIRKRVAADREAVWAAASELSPSPDYEVDDGICSACFTHVEDVAHVEWVTPSEAPPAEAPAKPRIRFRFKAKSSA